MAEQLRLDDAQVEAAKGMARSLCRLSDQALTDWYRILNAWVESGEVFCVDDMREQLDLAQIPHASRGALMKNAHKAGIVEWLGYRRSTHKATHAKPVGCWRKPLTAVTP